MYSVREFFSEGTNILMVFFGIGVVLLLLGITYGNYLSNNIKSYERAGDELFMEGNYEGALKCYEDALNQYPAIFGNPQTGIKNKIQRLKQVMDGDLTRGQNSNHIIGIPIKRGD